MTSGGGCQDGCVVPERSSGGGSQEGREEGVPGSSREGGPREVERDEIQGRSRGGGPREGEGVNWRGPRDVEPEGGGPREVDPKENVGPRTTRWGETGEGRRSDTGSRHVDCGCRGEK